MQYVPILIYEYSKIACVRKKIFRCVTDVTLDTQFLKDLINGNFNETLRTFGI